MKSVAILTVLLVATFSLSETHEDRAVKVFKDFVNWFKAAETCRRRGMQLMTVNTAKDSLYLMNLDRSEEVESLWTAATDLGESGEWVWFTTGQRVNKTYWAQWEPPRKNRNCIEALTDGEAELWRAVGCHELLPFICEETDRTLEKRRKSDEQFTLRALFGKFIGRN